MLYDQKKEKMVGYVDVSAGSQEAKREASEILVVMVAGTGN